MKDEHKKRDIFQTLLPAVFALIGVLSGVLVPGIFKLITQKSYSEKAQEIESLREFQEPLLKSSSEYLSLLLELSGMDQREITSEQGIKKYLEAQKTGVNLSLMTSFTTTQKIMENLITVKKLIKLRLGSDERKIPQENFANEYGELFIALCGEINSPQNRKNAPDKDKLISSITQLMPNMEKKD
ncbi:MAG: hypothetical protein ACLQUW_09260 [Desulfobaccales bacterium]